MTQKATAVGIDLGTTYSVVAQVDAFGQPKIIPNSDNERTTPSVVYVQEGQVLVGSIAKEQSAMAPADTLQFVKTFIGRRRKRFTMGGQTWSPEEISAMILRKLIQDAEVGLGEETRITHAVITVPAFFTEQQRKSTEDAGRIAGLEVMSIINEPTAAALAYGLERLGMDKKVVVYDLGGGTFDVTVMHISGDAITMLATDGDVQLGGKDWDERIIEHVAEEFSGRHGFDPRELPEMMPSLYVQAEQAKLRLSKLDNTRIGITCQGKVDSFDLNRTEFEELTEDLLSQTETTLRLTVQEAGLELGDIDEVLLVGGSTRMHSVRNMLTEIFGKAPKQVLNPDECVAQGAAIHAVMTQMKLRDQGIDVPDPLVLPDHLDRFRQMDERLINPHTLGILALDAQRQQVVAPIIPRRAYVPCRQVKTFRTSSDNQTQIRIVVMEGESARPDACSELGTCMIKGLPEGLPKGTPIEVCFECTHDSRLQVTSRLPTLNQEVQTEISRTLGMEENEILASRERIHALRIC